MKWFYIPTAMAAGILIVLGLSYEYNKIPKGKAVKVANSVLFTWSFVVGEQLFYSHTRNWGDLLLVNGFVLTYALITIILYKKREHINPYISFLAVIPLSFLLTYLINLYLTKPFSHIIWMGSLGGFYTGKAYDGWKKGILEIKRILLYGAMGILILLVLFQVLDENMDGTARFLREVEGFLMEQGYDMEGMDIHFYSFSKGPEAVGVSF